MFLSVGSGEVAGPPETRRVVHFQIQLEVLEPHGGAVLFCDGEIASVG